MKGPADVVVVGPLDAVGEPPVGAAKAVVEGKVFGHGVGGPGSPDGSQERLHHEAEPEPVRARVGAVPDGGRQVLDHALLYVRVEPVPDPRPRHVEYQRDGCGLDLRLPVLVKAHPTVGRRGIRPDPDALGVPLRQVLRVGSVLARESEAGEQERPGEPLEPVDGAPVAALGTR